MAEVREPLPGRRRGAPHPGRASPAGRREAAPCGSPASRWRPRLPRICRAARRRVSASWCCRPTGHSETLDEIDGRAASRSGRRPTTARTARSAMPGRGCATTTATPLPGELLLRPGDLRRRTIGGTRAARPPRHARGRGKPDGPTGANVDRFPGAQPRRRRARRWRPAPFVMGSLGVHGVAVLDTMAMRATWQSALGVGAANHLALAALGLWPRSTWLGRNLRTCLATARCAARSRSPSTTAPSGGDPRCWTCSRSPAAARRSLHRRARAHASRALPRDRRAAMASRTIRSCTACRPSPGSCWAACATRSAGRRPRSPR